MKGKGTSFNYRTFFSVSVCVPRLFFPYKQNKNGVPQTARKPKAIRAEARFVSFDLYAGMNGNSSKEDNLEH